MNKIILQMAGWLIVTACSLLPLTLQAQDQTVSGNLTVTGTADISGNTLSMGTLTGTATYPGWQLGYVDGTPSSISFEATRSANTWQWLQNGSGTLALQMSLSGSNTLTLFDQSSTPVAKITLNPLGGSTFANSLTVTGTLTVNGTNNQMPNQTLTGANSVLTEGLGDGRYLSNAPTSLALLPGASATGTDAIALGYNTSASGTYAVALGDGATAIGSVATAMGNSYASGSQATAMGGSYASGIGATAMGISSATGTYSTASGDTCTASEWGAVAMGERTNATGVGAVAMGYFTTATYGSLAAGTNSIASGQRTIAIGTNASATGAYSTALGWFPNAAGYTSTALGCSCTTNGAYALSAGYYSISNGTSSMALGYEVNASGFYSTAMGNTTTANSISSVALGQFNIGGGNFNNWITTDPLLELGNGTDATHLSDALIVYKNGNANFQGTVTGTGGFMTTTESVTATDIPMFGH